MSKAKKETYVYFEGTVKAKSDKWYLVDVDIPEEAKGLEIGMPISQIKGNPTNFNKDDKIMGDVLIWVIKRGVKEAKGEPKKEEKKEEVRSETKAGAPSVVNINMDNSGLAIMINGIAEQISGLANSILEVKELLKPKKSTKAKPKSQPTEANS